jgi:Leucine-rich repeat (LRR) protein
MRKDIKFTGNHLTVMPILELKDKASTKTIDFSNNHIKEIPREIAEFEGLIKLKLSGN